MQQLEVAVKLPAFFFEKEKRKKQKTNSTPCWEESVKIRSFGEGGNNWNHFTPSEIPTLQLGMKGMEASHSALSHS